MTPPNLSNAAADLYSAVVAWLEYLEDEGGINSAKHEQRLMKAMHAAAAKARGESL
jgi:hypothetical protein